MVSAQEVNNNLHSLKTLMVNNLVNRGVIATNDDKISTILNDILNINNKIPIHISLTSDKTTLNLSTDPTANITAQVLDIGNNPIKNINVTLKKDNVNLLSQSTDQNGKTIFNYTPETEGLSTLTAEVTSTDTYSFTTCNSVDISALRDITLSLTVAGSTYNDVNQGVLTINYSIDGVDASLQPTLLQNVKILVNNVDKTSAISNNQLTGLNAGYYTIVAQYPGETNKYNSATVTKTASIAKGSGIASISLSSTSVGAGSTITASGSGVGTIYIGTTSGGNNIATGSGSASGNYSQCQGGVTIYVTSLGDDNHNSKTVSQSCSFNSYGGALSGFGVSNSNPYDGDTVTISASSNQGSYHIYVKDGSSVTTYTNQSVNISKGAGSSVVVWASADGGCQYYSSSSGQTTISWKSKAGTSMGISGGSTTWGNSISLSASLGISGQSVAFYENGSYIGSSTTNSGGTAYYSVSKSSPTSASYSANYGGDGSHYGCSSGSTTCTWTKRSTYVSGYPGSMSKGQSFYVIIKGQQNEAVVGQSIGCTMTRVSTGVTATWYATTDTGGTATYNALNYTFTDTINFSGSYGGNDYYTGCSFNVNVSYKGS